MKVHIGILLSIGDKTPLFAPRVQDVKLFLGEMVNDSVDTVQAGRVMEEVLPHLHRQLPWLKEVSVEYLNSLITPEFKREINELYHQGDSSLVDLDLAWDLLDRMLDPVIQKYGKYHEVSPIPPDDHDRIHPVEDFKKIMRRMGRIPDNDPRLS